MSDPSTMNPLEQRSDAELVELALRGELRALERLLRRQQPWIFNLAFYMLHHRQDAEDAVQEVLVKIATGLAGFRGASSFRTWSRRIAVNHVLDCRRSRPETVVTGFGCYAEYLDKAPDAELGCEVDSVPERALLVDEARVSCTLGMLLCLDREQRVTFLLGEILETSDAVAAELLSITKDNYRQRLSRAREQLSSFMQGRCGLVRSENPCRCARKTAAFIRDGIVDPSRLQFARGHVAELEAAAGEHEQRLAYAIGRTREELRALYPLFEAPNVAARLDALLKSHDLRSALNLEAVS